MATLTDIQNKLNDVKQELNDLTHQAANTVSSFTEPSGETHQQIQAELDDVTKRVSDSIDSASDAVKTTVKGWFAKVQ